MLDATNEYGVRIGGKTAVSCSIRSSIQLCVVILVVVVVEVDQRFIMCACDKKCIETNRHRHACGASTPPWMAFILHYTDIRSATVSHGILRLQFNYNTWNLVYEVL